MHVAIVTGARGRLGSAFASRLRRDGYAVEGVDVGDPPHRLPAPGEPAFLFDCAYTHGDPGGHVRRASAYLVDWRRYSAIFLPSSMWIGSGDDYGRAKIEIERLADAYAAEGAHVVTDRIGYFPGDDGHADPAEPMYAHLVTGDLLYARVMARMRVPARSAAQAELDRVATA